MKSMSAAGTGTIPSSHALEMSYHKDRYLSGEKASRRRQFMTITADIKRAAQALREADALLLTAGAGMGVDSGLPDFRGDKGFWKAYPAIAKLGRSFVEMANPYWFHHEPKLAWAFYGHRLNLYRRTVPHAGFTHLLELAQGKPGAYFVFTSNVDGHFQKAGYDENRIEECHGSIHYVQCNEPCCGDIWEAPEILVDEDRFEAVPPLPLCRNCGRLARPNVLMFGDWTWIATRSDEQADKFSKWLTNLAMQRMNLAVVEIGAGEAVPTVRNLSESIIRTHDATLIRINPRDYRVPSERHIALPLGAMEAIRAILES